MNRIIFLLLTVIVISATAQPLSKRIVPNDPAKYRLLSAVHAGAGQMKFTELVGRQALSTNFLYLHAGEIQAKSGIGHHFHHTIEEMFVILDGEAEFTINGRTARLKAPAIVPCKMGNSHGIYNASSKPLRWLNFAVSTTKGRGDAFDLGDTRVGAAIDPVPTFVTGLLRKETLTAANHPYAGNGALYRRVLRPEVFSTSWNHVDHVILPAGSSAGPRSLEGIEEVYFVMNGSGTVTINTETAPIKAGDAFQGLLGEKVTMTNNGKDDLELLVIGVSATKNKDPNLLRPLAKPKAMALQMDFVVAKENAEAFEKMYHSIYVPAMTVQQGYLESKLLRIYADSLATAIQGEKTNYNYQIQISFDTEQNRRRWVASPQHQIAWPAATSLAKEYKWRGYDVMGDNDNR
jgi:mannose-6-phosphate isomerase-like protein (cupin superfamily)